MMDTYHRARQYNKSGGLAQLAGDSGLLAAFCFWAWVYWGFIQPSFTSPQNTFTIGAVVSGLFLAGFTVILAFCSAVVQPALHAALFPNTVAAQYLHKLRRSTWGFSAVGTADLILFGFSAYILWMWWNARLGIGDDSFPFTTQGTILAVGFTAMTLIFFVIVPAWATNYGTPVLWATEVQQSHEVNKLEVMHRGEIAILKARLLWAEQRAAMSYANLLPTEQIEIRDTLRGLFMGIADTQRSIVRALEVSANVEREFGIPDDATIADTMDRIAVELDKPAQQIAAMLPPDVAPLRVDTGHGDSRSGSSIPRDTQGAPRSAPQHGAAPRTMAHDPEIDVVKRELTSVWTAKELAAVLKIEQRTAQETIARWKKDGRIREIRLGRYSLTESEA